MSDLEATESTGLRIAKPSVERDEATRSFAAYLAERYVADHGFTHEVPREAAALAKAFDHVVTYSDGMSFSILAIVDAERDVSKKTTLSEEDLVAIGKACLGFTGRMNGAKVPAVIHVVEVRPAVDAAARARLTALKRMPGFAKVGIRTMIAVPATREAWSSAFFGKLATRYVRRVLAEPRRDPADRRDPPVAATMSKKKPVLTIAMLAVLAAVFGVELLSAPTESFATPSIGTLVALGGLRGSLVTAHGEWWRLFTATLLHAGPLHLLLNGVALFLAGVVLESLLGRAWLAALFVIGALGGSLAGLLFNAPELVSVGASGAIMGLLAAAIVASFRLPPRDRARVLSPLLQFLIPSLLPIAFERSGGHIDFAAHFGGAVAGAVVGLLLMRTWPRSSPAPRGKKLALAGAAVGGLAYAAGVVLMVGAYERWSGAATVALLPNEELRTIEQADPDALAAKYPRDPRVRWVRAMHAADRQDLATAERELRAAIEDEAIFAIYFEGTKLEPEIRATLARVLEVEGRHDEALEIARPACGSGADDIVPFCP